MPEKTAAQLMTTSDPHEHLADVVAREQADERGRRVLDPVDDGLAVAQAAVSHPWADLGEERRHPVVVIRDDEPSIRRRFVTTRKRFRGPTGGSVALYCEMAPQATTRPRTRNAASAASSVDPPTLSKYRSMPSRQRLADRHLVVVERLVEPELAQPGDLLR